MPSPTANVQVPKLEYIHIQCKKCLRITLGNSVSEMFIIRITEVSEIPIKI